MVMPDGMLRRCRLTGRVAVLGCSIITLAAIVLTSHTIWRWRDSSRVAATNAAIAMLRALRDGSVPRVQASLHSRSGDAFAFRRSSRVGYACVAKVGRSLRLQGLTDEEIRSRITPVTLPDKLFQGILRWGTRPCDKGAGLGDDRRHIAFLCDLPGSRVILLCMPDARGFAVFGLPTISAEILRYARIEEASAHGAAVVD